MDIPDFEIVIQWRAENLTMCSLMQRLGRAARDPSLNGTFVLFAESKYFDRNKKPDTPGQSKSGKQGQSRDCGRSAPVTAVTQAPDPPPERPSIDELKSNRKSIYADHYWAQRSSPIKGKSTKQTGIDPGVDDSVNASERGFDCRIIPGDVTFGNDNICASSGCLFMNFILSLMTVN